MLLGGRSMAEATSLGQGPRTPSSQGSGSDQSLRSPAVRGERPQATFRRA